MAKDKGARKAPKGEKGPTVKGALLGRVTDVVAVLFGLSLAAQQVVARVG